jgi:hypothetical protein
MTRRGLVPIVVIPLLIAACTGSPKPSNQASNGSSTPAQNASQTTPPRQPQIINPLPADAEGVEIANGALWPKKGYKIVKDSDTTFVVMRMSDGKPVMNGSCHCRGNPTGDCKDAVGPGGNAICTGTCGQCGLVRVANGVSTELIRY